MPDESKGVSGRRLAEILGVSEGAVRKAADPKTGRISKARLPNGKFDPAMAKDLWKANTDPTQQRTITAATDASRLKAAPAAKPSSPPTEPPKVVPFPGKGAPRLSQDDAAARLAEHRQANLDKGKAKKAADEEGLPDDGSETTAALIAELYREKIRKLRLENELTEKAQIDRFLTFHLVEGVARETRDAWGQFADQFGPEFVSAFGLQDREVEVFTFTRRACDRHVVQTLANIDPMRHIQRLVEE